MKNCWKRTKGGKDYWKITEKLNSAIATIDVSNSGLQILGALTGELQALESTNLITQQVKETKEDLYRNILDIFKEHALFSTMVKKHAPFKQFVRQQITRDFMKGWVMRFVYSEGHFSRAQYVKNLYPFDPDKNNKQIFEFAQLLSNLFIQAMKNTYPEICQLSAQIQRVLTANAKNSKHSGLYLVLNNEDSLRAFISFGKLESKKFEYFDTQTKKKTKMVLQIETTKLDSRKFRNGVVPHFIHFLDSDILADVVLKCKQNNIPVSTIHDCFVVPMECAEILKDFYFESFTEKLFSKDATKDPLYQLFLQNGINLEGASSGLAEETKVLLKKVVAARFKIMEKIQDGTFRRSHFILS